jgi:hypothetical protein
MGLYIPERTTSNRERRMKKDRGELLHRLAGGFAVNLETKMITGEKKIRNRLSLYSALHECGHLTIYNSPRDIWVAMSFDQICEEIMAWKYAKNCVKPQYWDELEEFAVVNILSYVRSCISPNFFTDDLLYFMLRWGDIGERPTQYCDILHSLSLRLLERVPSYYWKISKLVRIIGICVRDLVEYSLNGRYPSQT